MIVASTTFRCHGCGQLLPFDRTGRVPDACLRRCQGRCDWHAVGSTDPHVRARAAFDGPVDVDGLPTGADGNDRPGHGRADRRPDRTGTAS